MAKIVYHVSPFDHSKKRDLDLSGTIGEILSELKLENTSVCVVLNGTVPDECDLSYQTKDDDLIEIHKIVQGEGSASGKQSLAMILQVAALVTIYATGIGGLAAAGILIGSSIISGALMKRAAELNSASGQAEADVDVSANKYSLSNASNEARPLQPMPLVMGSHRIAPDVHADAMKRYMNAEVTVGEATPISVNVYPGVTSGNGAFSVNSNWALMPAGYIQSGFPQEDILISPYLFDIPTGPISPADNLYVIDLVKSQYLSAGNPSQMKFPLGSSYMPLIVAHADLSSTFYGRYNAFHYLARLHQAYSPSDFVTRMTLLYNGNTYPFVGPPDYSDRFFATTTGGTSNKELIKISPTLNYWYPDTISAADDPVGYIPKMGAWLLALNGGTYGSLPKTLSYQIKQFYTIETTTSIIQEGTEYSTQVFNYGIGDLAISDRKIGMNIVGDDWELCGWAPRLDENGLFPDPPWNIQSVPEVGVPGTPARFFKFFERVTALERKALFNISSPNTFTEVTNQEQYNWIQMEGAIGLGNFSSYITGQVYATSGGGLASNSCTLEVQYRISGTLEWTTYNGFLTPLGVVIIQNDNPKKVTFLIQLLNIDVGDNRLQVRIRKVTLDEDNNDAGKICNLYVDNVRFYQKTLNGDPVEYSPNVPLNLEGLVVTALITDVAQTNKYSALVQSRCWVYHFDTETWLWEENRNPAFWFLYYANGGFRNIDYNQDSPGWYSYPNSATTGWISNPEHPDNTERIFGAGLKNSEIDMDKILEWAQWCDDRELYMDMVLKDDTSCADVLERIANVGRGAVTYYNGLLSVVYENPEQVPTCLFGMGNIKAGSFAVQYQLEDPVRKIICKYVNRETWETEEVEAIVPYSDPENLKEVEINLEGVTETQQAQRECNIMAARQYFQRRTYSWEVDIEGLIAKRGNLVYLSHDATQYGFSGRVKRFIVEAGVVTAIETTSILDSSINYITVKEPNGEMNIYACHLEGERIVFDDPYPIEKASQYITNTVDNALTDYPNSIPEDFTFISGSKETPGKIVRISQIEAGSDFTFKITAVDEDPAMWAFEYEEEEDPESFDDSELALSVTNVQIKDLGEGLVKVYWENVNGDMIQILNEDTMTPIEANGSFTFTGGEVTLELNPNTQYKLIIRPFAIGTPFKSVDKRVGIWLK